MTEQCQLRLISKRWIGGCKVVNLTKSHFEQYREDRLKEVKSGTECGIGVLNYTDVQPGDQIEVFERIERARSL